VVWAARHQHPYMNLGSLLEHTHRLRDVYIDTARETGFEPGPEHFGYLLRIFCADTDEKAQEIGREFLWTQEHRNRGPREHNDPPGYQSREAVDIQRTLPGAGGFGRTMTYEELQDANNIIVGSPDTVREKLSMIIDRLNPGYLHVYGNEGAMDHADVMRSIELIGKEVIPALHEIPLVDHY
jgi:alkanesulfonate monooxygenase SsuD/methylene tetrahydromethanopterin reductase-like flavin-dependent oxidoreductase (luciferase family)